MYPIRPAPPVQVTPERPEIAETDQTVGTRLDRRTHHADGARPMRVRTSSRNRRVDPPALQRAGEPVNRANAAASAPRFELSLHAVVTLAGTTALDLAGYEAKSARQSHRAFGMRVVVARPGASWGVEANVSGEWPVGPTVHTGGNAMQPEEVEVSGPLLRADAGLRARFGVPWSATAYAGIGLHAFHQDIEAPTRPLDRPDGDMQSGGALALGMGLGYRTRKVLLGLELHVRQGVPDDYRSVAALLSVGCFLDQENEP